VRFIDQAHGFANPGEATSPVREESERHVTHPGNRLVVVRKFLPMQMSLDEGFLYGVFDVICRDVESVDDGPVVRTKELFELTLTVARYRRG